MDFKFQKLLLCIIALLNVVIAPAQSFSDSSSCDKHKCTCDNDPTPAGVMISHVHLKNEWMLSYRYMGMHMQGLNTTSQAKNGNDVLQRYSASPDFMQMNMHMVMVMYGITDRLTVMGMLNYNSVYMKMTMLGEAHHHHGMNSTGIGDTKLYALYALVKKEKTQFLVSSGINLPSGSIMRKGETDAMMYAGQRLPYSMQNGSGTYDLLPALNLLHQHNTMYYCLQVSSIIRANRNSLGYRFGNELSLNGWYAWHWLPFISNSIRIEGNLAGAIKGCDPTLDPLSEISANPSNYGGHRLFLYAGISTQPKTGFLKTNRFSLEYGLPLYQDLNGIQASFKSTLVFAWVLKF